MPHTPRAEQQLAAESRKTLLRAIKKHDRKLGSHDEALRSERRGYLVELLQLQSSYPTQV